MKARRVLHIFVNSVPVLKGGSIRGKYIVVSQRREGIDVAVVTSQHHPFEGDTEEEINGISYYRTKPLPFAIYKVPFVRIHVDIWYLRRRVLQVARLYRPDLIHTHSTYVCGFAGLGAARTLGVPCIHEIRALNEDSRVALGEIRADSWQYDYTRRQVTKLVKMVDSVVAISTTLQQDVLSRGVEEDKVGVVVNGVDTTHFSPRPKNIDLATQWSLHRPEPVIGFVGSIRRLEGLDCLLRAMPRMLQHFNDARLLLVGDGSDRERLVRIAKDLGIQSQTTFTGQVDHAAVPDYYSLMDVVVVPRTDSRVNHLVTPLKPLEALAMGKPLVISDVGGLKEVVPEDDTRVVFRADDEQDLAAECIHLLSNSDYAHELGEKGREWVVAERDWDAVVRGYGPIYERVLGRASDEIIVM